MGLSTSKLPSFNKLCKIYRKRILNCKKSILKEIPSPELSFIALYQKMITRNCDDKLGLCFLSQKLRIHSERFRVIVFQYGAKTINRNSEFSLPSMIPRATKNSELSFLCIGPKTITHNLEFTWEWTPSFPRILSYRYAPPPPPDKPWAQLEGRKTLLPGQ